MRPPGSLAERPLDGLPGCSVRFRSSLAELTDKHADGSGFLMGTAAPRLDGHGGTMTDDRNDELSPLVTQQQTHQRTQTSKESGPMSPTAGPPVTQGRPYVWNYPFQAPQPHRP
jgi:hypothetical protein